MLEGIWYGPDDGLRCLLNTCHMSRKYLERWSEWHAMTHQDLQKVACWGELWAWYNTGDDDIGNNQWFNYCDKWHGNCYGNSWSHARNLDLDVGKISGLIPSMFGNDWCTHTQYSAFSSLFWKNSPRTIVQSCLEKDFFSFACNYAGVNTSWFVSWLVHLVGVEKVGLDGF